MEKVDQGGGEYMQEENSVLEDIPIQEQISQIEEVCDQIEEMDLDAPAEIKIFTDEV